MSVDWTLVHVLAVLFVATVVRSAFGFGEALIAVPLLSLVIAEKVAAPLAVLVSITVAGVVVAQDWRKVHVRSAGWLVLFTLLGTPLGLWLLLTVSEPLVKAVLALVLVSFSSYCLVNRAPVELKNDRLAWLFGFLAGVLGGAYGVNGPPLVIYGTLRRWTPEHFRATLQGYFLPASLAGMAGYWLAGLWVREVTYYYLWSLPVVWAAIAVGRFIHGRLKDRRFLTYVHVGLIMIGIALLLQSAWHWIPQTAPDGLTARRERVIFSRTEYNAGVIQPGTRNATMKIYGVSQSSGVERQLTIERGVEGVVLTLNDHVGGKEQGRIFVPADSLVAAIMQPPPGGLTVEGIVQPQQPHTLLEVEVRGNDVLMTMRPGADVAVGLDDIQDALEGVIGGSSAPAGKRNA